MSSFQELFQEMEQSNQLIGVDYFSISMTTLDEVFLKLGEADSNQSLGIPAANQVSIGDVLRDESEEVIDRKRADVIFLFKFFIKIFFFL